MDEKNQDLIWIKKHYSEKLMHIVRSLFPSLLETKGLLPQLLSEHFAPSSSLGADIEAQGKEQEFKNFIYSLVDVENENEIVTHKSAVELLEEAGYILYPECKNEEDIQKFRKYYDRRGDGETPKYEGDGYPQHSEGEELCTFNGERLKRCRVWWIVKKEVGDIDNPPKGFKGQYLGEIKRSEHPQKNDDYSLSVLSIQIDEDGYVQIISRYNHSVNNPNCTLNNDLDNIVAGLTEAFQRDFGVSVNKNNAKKFEIDDYICGPNGKFYHFNHEIRGIYYCENNTIIDHGKVLKLPSHQVLMDYFVVDPSKNTIKLYDKVFSDSFVDSLGEIEKIVVENIESGKQIRVKVKNGEDVLMTIDKYSKMTSLTNTNLTKCGDDFLCYNGVLTSLNLPNLTKCGYDFLCYNKVLTSLSLNLPKLTECGNGFLRYNKVLTSLNLPNLTKCGNDFLCYNGVLTSLNLPNLTKCGDDFLYYNGVLTSLNLPNLTKCGYDFLHSNEALTSLNLPKLTECGSGFLFRNNALKNLNLPNLTSRGECFLYNNLSLKIFNCPNLTK